MNFEDFNITNFNDWINDKFNLMSFMGKTHLEMMEINFLHPAAFHENYHYIADNTIIQLEGIQIYYNMK